jgi:F0F1-type ATP synthase assembly protein I
MGWKPPFKTTREQREEFRNSADASTIAWFFFSAILIGFLLGLWVDKTFHTAPWGSTVGACLGIATGFVNLVQVANKIARREEEESRRKREGHKDDE